MKYTALVSDWSAIRTNTAAAISEKTWTFHHHLYNYADKLDLLAEIKIDHCLSLVSAPRLFGLGKGPNGPPGPDWLYSAAGRNPIPPLPFIPDEHGILIVVRHVFGNGMADGINR